MKVQIRPRGPSSVKLKFTLGIPGPTQEFRVNEETLVIESRPAGSALPWGPVPGGDLDDIVGPYREDAAASAAAAAASAIQAGTTILSNVAFAQASAYAPGTVGAQLKQIEEPSKRKTHTYTPEYNLFSNTLSTSNFYHAGDITIPGGMIATGTPGKQHNIIRMDGTFRGGDKGKGIDFQFNVYDSDDAYGVIGYLSNYGSGPVKAMYGRAVMMPGSTGVGVGLIAGTNCESGANPSHLWGIQISMSGYETVGAKQHNAIMIGTDNQILAINDSVIELDHGIVADDRVGYSDAFIKAYNGTQNDSGTVPRNGSFLKWQEVDGTVLFEVDKNGAIIKRSPSGTGLFEVAQDGAIIRRTAGSAFKAFEVAADGAVYKRNADTGVELFRIDLSGHVHMGSSAAASQRELHLFSTATDYLIQAVNSGNYVRIRDNTIGYNMLQLAGAGATNAVSMYVGGALKTVEAGAADSGGAGYKMLRVAN